MNKSTNTLEVVSPTETNVHKGNITQSEAFWLEIAEDLKELSEILKEAPP